MTIPPVHISSQNQETPGLLPEIISLIGTYLPLRDASSSLSSFEQVIQQTGECFSLTIHENIIRSALHGREREYLIHAVEEWGQGDDSPFAFPRLVAQPETLITASFFGSIFSKLPPQKLHHFIQSLVARPPNITSLDFSKCKLLPETIALLCELPQFSSLTLGHVESGHFREIGKLTKLTHLKIYHLVDVGDRDLQSLKELILLESLHLGWCTSFSDEGVQHLKALKALRALHLNDCSNITDRSLEWLKNEFAALRQLSLTGCHNITDEGLAHLKMLTALETLDLSYCHAITDVGLEHLPSLTALQSLNLTHCLGITDMGLRYLKGLIALRKLNPLIPTAEKKLP